MGTPVSSAVRGHNAGGGTRGRRTRAGTSRVGTPAVLLVLLALAGLGGLCLIAGARVWERFRDGLDPQPLPAFPTAPPYTPWPTPPVAAAFDFPLLPAEEYGPYVRGESGPLAVDAGEYTRALRRAEPGARCTLELLS